MLIDQPESGSSGVDGIVASSLTNVLTNILCAQDRLENLPPVLTHLVAIVKIDNVDG